MDSAQVVRRFEDEFKNNSNFAIVDELMSEDFVHHLPYPGLPPGRAGMRAVGKLVTAAIRDIHAEIPLVVADGDLVADRVEATGVRTDTGSPLAWVENHIYRVAGGQITEMWPAGGPELS
jgi:ketosteroid isomerase-like protein